MYWRAAQRQLPGLLLLAAGASLAAWLVVNRLSPVYEVHFSYLISLSEPERASEYRFDGYYALSATDLFAETLAAWFRAPESVVAAYQSAGLDLPSQDARAVTRSVSAEKKSSQLVAVTVRGSDRQQAVRLADGLKETAERRVEQYHDEGIPTLRWRTVASEPWVSTREISRPVVAGATFVFVLLGALNIVMLRESLRGT